MKNNKNIIPSFHLWTRLACHPFPWGRGPFFKAFQFWQSVRLHRALGAVLQQKEWTTALLHTTFTLIMMTAASLTFFMYTITLYIATVFDVVKVFLNHDNLVAINISSLVRWHWTQLVCVVLSIFACFSPLFLLCLLWRISLLRVKRHPGLF